VRVCVCVCVCARASVHMRKVVFKWVGEQECERKGEIQGSSHASTFGATCTRLVN